MALLQVSEVRSKAGAASRANGAVLALKSVRESQELGAKTYDIFLSHAIKDAELVLGIRQILIDQGFSVYVDWIDDPALDRNNVTPATAEQLRNRMKLCTALLFAVSDNSPNSKWMPWELGYFDGLRSGRVAIIPISDTYKFSYTGQEYLGLYPYVDIAKPKDEPLSKLWINDQRNSNVYVRCDSWVKGKAPSLHK